MTKIDKYIPAIDKLKHAYLWTLLFFATSFFFVIVLGNARVVLVVSLCITIITAAYKELVIDGLQGKGRKELLDFLFSILFPCLTVGLYFLCIFV